MSESQYTTPLVISSRGVAKLQKIPLVSNKEDKGYDEAWIQKIAFEKRIYDLTILRGKIWNTVNLDYNKD